YRCAIERLWEIMLEALGQFCGGNESCSALAQLMIVGTGLNVWADRHIRQHNIEFLQHELRYKLIGVSFPANNAYWLAQMKRRSDQPLRNHFWKNIRNSNRKS